MPFIGITLASIIMAFMMLQSEDEWNRRFITVAWATVVAFQAGWV